MKNLINNWQVRTLVALAAVILGFSACKKDDKEGNKAAPIVERVRTLSKLDTTYKETRVTLDSNKYGNVVTRVGNDETVTGARWNAQYMLVGQNLLTTLSITLNGVSLFFNPALVTETGVIFTVANDVPYGSDLPNKLKVTTKYGSVEYSFGLLQPYPVITSVSPLLGEVGGTVTVTGTYFDNLKSIKFGTVDAEIVGTPTNKEIKIKIPTGITQANITITTAGGSAVSANSFFAFRKILYQDGWLNGMTSWGGWGGTGDIDNTTGGVRGTKSIRLDFTAGGYGSPLQMVYQGTPITLSSYTSLKLSIYGGPGTAGKKAKIQLNGDANFSETLTLTEGTFTDYVIPLSNFPSSILTAPFSKIWVLDASGAKTSIYVDEMGLL